MERHDVMATYKITVEATSPANAVAVAQEHKLRDWEPVVVSAAPEGTRRG